MCIAVPVRVIKIEESEALVELERVYRTISIELVPEVREGDYVLLHAGCALQIIDRQEALETLSLLKGLAEKGSIEAGGEE